MRPKAGILVCAALFAVCSASADAGRCRDVVTTSANAVDISVASPGSPGALEQEAKDLPALPLAEIPDDIPPSREDLPGDSAGGDPLPAVDSRGAPRSADGTSPDADALPPRDRSIVALMYREAYSHGRANHELACYVWYRTAQSMLDAARRKGLPPPRREPVP